MTDTGDVEIVLIEDNVNDVELTVRVLKKHRLANKIRVIKDGEEAMKYLSDIGPAFGHTPKVILLDIKLPKISGLDILRKLKTDPRLKTIPVVILTSSHEERDIIESYQLGVNSYIVKPIDFTQFSDSITQIGLYWLVMNKPPLP